jgi:hypothetical protein
MASANKGFGGQWVEVIGPGRHTDTKGVVHEIDAAYLEQIVANFDASLHEPPAVIGHPSDDAPAYGWVSALRLSPAGVLEAQFSDTDATFEEMVRAGKFKKRSAALYLDPKKAPAGRVPALRHVGFLGAQPPAVKGLKNIHFSEGEAVTFDINFSEGESSMDDKDVDRVASSVWEKFKAQFGFGTSEKTANFSEADVKKMVNEAITTATSSFSEDKKRLETRIEELTKTVEHQAGKTTRAELIAFCERVGSDKLPPALRKLGVVEFMETLADMGDEKVTVVTFSEKEDGTKVEAKTESSPLAWFKNFLTTLQPLVAFGEQFASLDASGASNTVIDPKRVEKLKKDAGMEPAAGGAK